MVLWLAPKPLQDEETQTSVPHAAGKETAPVNIHPHKVVAPPSHECSQLSSAGQGSYIHYPPIIVNSINSHFPTVSFIKENSKHTEKLKEQIHYSLKYQLLKIQQWTFLPYLLRVSFGGTIWDYTFLEVIQLHNSASIS